MVNLQSQTKKMFHVKTFGPTAQVPFGYDDRPVPPVRTDEVVAAERKAFKCYDPGPGFDSRSKAETVQTTRRKALQQNTLRKERYQDEMQLPYAQRDKLQTEFKCPMQQQSQFSARLKAIRAESLNSLYLPGDQYYGPLLEQRQKAYRELLSGPMIGKEAKIARSRSVGSLHPSKPTQHQTVFSQNRLSQAVSVKTLMSAPQATVRPLVCHYPLVSLDEVRARYHARIAHAAV